MTGFRGGGPAAGLFRPTDAGDLAAFLAALPDDVPVTVIGVGSNLLVRDGGIPGITIRLGRGFAEIAAEGDVIRAGAGTLDLNVALSAAEAGIAGLEFLSGVPGTIGGGLRMQTPAPLCDGEVKDVRRLSRGRGNRAGKIHRVPADALGLSYRHSSAPDNWIFTGALLRGRRGDPTEIGRRMNQIRAAREASQPIRARTGGSTFASPPGDQA